jgi:hypothetical protein
MNLYQLSTRFEQLIAQDELNAEECAELEQLHIDIEDECISRGKYIRNLEAEAAAIKEAIKEMSERELNIMEKAFKQREKLAERMRACNLKKITKSPLFPVSWKENPVSVDDYDRTAIPQDFWRTKVTESKSVDKDAIKKAIEAGKDVPGARLIRKVKVEFK